MSETSVFRRPPLDTLPRFDDMTAYSRSRPGRRIERGEKLGVWNTGSEPTEEVVTFYLIHDSRELIAVRNPLGLGPSLPVVLVARGVSKDEIEEASRRAKDKAAIDTPDNVNNLDWLLTWSGVGRGLSRRRRPYIAHPRQLLYG